MPCLAWRFRDYDREIYEDKGVQDFEALRATIPTNYEIHGQVENGIYVLLSYV